jgi:hypothetical protein
VPRDKA